MTNRRVVEVIDTATPHTADHSNHNHRRQNKKRRRGTDSANAQRGDTNRPAHTPHIQQNQQNQRNQPSQRKKARNKSNNPGKPVHVIAIDDSDTGESSPVEVIDVDDSDTEASTTQQTHPAPPPPQSASSTAASVMEQLESDDYFQVLGLTRSATDADIKKAYRKLAIQWHPDKNRDHPKAEEYFKRIAEAYEILSDPEKRKHYERYGKANASTSPQDGYTYRGGAPHHGDFAYHEFSARHARDIFEAFFGGRDPFADAFFGGAGGGGRRRQSRHPFDEMDDEDFGFGGGFGMPMMMPMMMGFGGGGNRRTSGGGFGFGGGGLMDSFFSDDFGTSAFGGGGGFSSHSVSTSTFTDRNGHVVTKKTTTTTNADGRTDTVTEEYRNGKLINSSSSGSTATSRLADAGRLQLDSAPRSRDGSRKLTSSGHQRSNRAL